jgi:hypothetical protein
MLHDWKRSTFQFVIHSWEKNIQILHIPAARKWDMPSGLNFLGHKFECQQYPSYEFPHVEIQYQSIILNTIESPLSYWVVHICQEDNYIRFHGPFTALTTAKSVNEQLKHNFGNASTHEFHIGNGEDKDSIVVQRI